MIAIDLQNHQQEVPLPEALLPWLKRVIPLVIEHAQNVATPMSVLTEIESLDIAFIDQAASDDAHRRFMNIPGATDVITFQHGELLICPAVAARQAQEHLEPFWRELFRYIVHGILHLAGYDDHTKADADAMHAIQERIVTATAATAPEFI